MKITVLTESKSLKELLGTQLEDWLKAGNRYTGQATIQNLTTTDLYIENGLDASIANGTVIKANTYGSNTIPNIGNLNIIAGAEATDVRVLLF